MNSIEYVLMKTKVCMSCKCWNACVSLEYMYTNEPAFTMLSFGTLIEWQAATGSIYEEYRYHFRMSLSFKQDFIDRTDQQCLSRCWNYIQLWRRFTYNVVKMCYKTCTASENVYQAWINKVKKKKMYSYFVSCIFPLIIVSSCFN